MCCASLLETVRAGENARVADEDVKGAEGFCSSGHRGPQLQSLERLMIIALWIKADVVDKDFLEKLEALLKTNVAVFIGYGINKQPTASLALQHQAA